jgi:uncharacterized phage protein (TIGR02218 family)
VILELYKIVIDDSSDGSAFHFCNGDEPFEHEGDTYEPVTIGRSDMAQGEEINRQNVQIRVPFDNPVAAVYLEDTPDVVAIVTVFRVQDADTSEPTVLTFWKGRIAGTRAEGQQMLLECESVFTSMRRTGARARYQVQCRHALYGTACGVNKASYAVAGTVSAVDDVLLTVTGADSEADGYFVGGMIEFDGVFRFIVGHTGTTIRLWRAMPGLAAASSVTLYPGCNRTLGVCNERFNNALNYGGFPWLPNTNPFQNVNLY